MTRVQQLRLRTLAEHLRGSLWFLPSLAVVIAVVLAEVARRISPAAGSSALVDVDGARSLLATIAGSVITVTGLVFSLMVVSLQLASQQFSPRLLRTFLRDRGTQVVLSVFLATFAYSLTVLRSVRGAPEPFVPTIAVAGTFVFALGSVIALVYFIHHATVEIRVDTMMRDVARETFDTIAYIYPNPQSSAAAEPFPPTPPDAALVPAAESGFLQDVSLAALAAAARTEDVLVRVHVPVGEFVVAGTPLVWVWRPDGAHVSDDACDRIAAAVARALQTGHERTIQGDVAFGIRQLVDIAVKALSPAINDPTTAVHAIDRLAAMLCVLAGRRLEPRIASDEDGRVRAVVPSRSFDEFIDLACGQIRRYGASEPAITISLLRLLTLVGGCSDDSAERASVMAQADLVMGAAERETKQLEDLRGVRSARDAVSRALEGDQRP